MAGISNHEVLRDDWRSRGAGDRVASRPQTQAESMAKLGGTARAGEGQARIASLLAAAFSLLVAAFAGTAPAPLPLTAQAERGGSGIDAPRPGAAAAIRQPVGLPSASDARARSERADWLGNDGPAVQPRAAAVFDGPCAISEAVPIAGPQRPSLPVSSARPRGPPSV